MILDNVDIQTEKGRTRVRLKCDQCCAEIVRDVGVIRKSRALHGSDVCKSCVTVNYNKSRPMEVRKRAGAASAEKCKGRTLEEIVGVDRARTIRHTLSEQRTGEKNHNFGGKHQRFPIRTGTLEQQFGLEKAARIRKKMSDATRGEKNGMFGVPTPKRAGGGISGHYKTYYFRSLLELSYIRHLEENKIRFVSCDGRSDFKFKYFVGGQQKTYFPDFYLLDSETIVEVKPARLAKYETNIAKGEAVKKAGRLFKFVTENEIKRLEKQELMILISSNIVTIDKNKERMLHL